MITLSWNPGSDGGSPVTQWEYKVGRTLANLSASNVWTTICHNNPPAAPDPSCASTSSVTVPRPDPDGPDGPQTAPDLAVDINGDGTVDDLSANPELAWPVAGGTYYFVVRATNARTDNNHLSSGVTRATFSQSAPSAPRTVHIQTTAAGTTPGTASVTLTWAASITGGSPITDYEYSTKAGDGSWSPWTSAGLSTSTPADTDGDTVELIGGLSNGTTYTFRVRARNAIDAGAYSESPAIIPGAPGSPGAASGTSDGCPRLVAAPGTTEVLLTHFGTDGSTLCTTGNVNANTQWQYSYKIGDGDWGGWLFAGSNGSFNPAEINPSNTAGNAIDGLENGVMHTFRIRALNGQLSSPILESNPTTPGVAPPAPQGVTASAGNRSVTLSWTSGGDGGPPITGWEYCTYITQTSTQRAATPPESTTAIDCAVLTGETSEGWTPIQRSGADTTGHVIAPADPTVITAAPVNGTAYTYLVRARNAIGGGAPAQANAATPGLAPLAPARVLVDPADGQVRITVDKPPTNLQDPAGLVTGYQVRKRQGDGPYDSWETLGTSAPAALTAETSGAVVSGLINGVSYTFEVRAVNAHGPGGATESNTVTPTGAPEANELAASPGDGQVALGWNQLSSGGSTITKWQYRMSESGGGYGAWMDIADSGPATTSHVVTGLSNGVSYAFEVRGVNVNLEMVNAEPITSAAVVPSTVPPAPSVTAARGNGQVDLTWTAGTSGDPGEDDYAALTTGWQVRVDDGAWSDIDDSNADTTSHSVAGLTNGQAYTFEVRAVNAFGAGEAGSASATPATTPSAPEVSAERGDGTTAVSWTAGDDGGSAVTSWHLQVNGGEWVALDVEADASSHDVSTNDGDAYTFGVRAVNAVGEGAAGTASVEAGSAPAAPTVTAVGGSGTITVSWTAGDDGGSSITGWHYRMKVSIGEYGEWMEASADTSMVTLTDLASGTGVLSYTFQVRGVNGVGNGEEGTSNAVEPTEASAANGAFYSGVVTGPDFCANMSLGGARLFAHDDDGDGVADVCSLPYTRREAIARQNAVDALVIQYHSEYAALVSAACAITEGDADCGGDMTAAPPAVPINDGGAFYSGVITGPSFCANQALGGPTTYPHDDDKDGVADVCALPYTRREAIARQLAGDILAATYAADFRRELASACRGLTGGDYGDDPEDLARDACA
ncbi:MAG: fibronectin type III domain-containing protein [bacterium]|nr:fibronectin type III domain-containing protein [bacterium]